MESLLKTPLHLLEQFLAFKTLRVIAEIFVSSWGIIIVNWEMNECVEYRVMWFVS